MAEYLLAIDQGTTGSTALVMDTAGTTVGRANVEFNQYYPQPGWVEHEPDDIWNSIVSAIGMALEKAGVLGHQIAGIGVTNQRETTLLWDRKSGEPVHRAIVWQCRRTASICERLKAQGFENKVRQTTGLVLDPYFSGTKLTWLFDNVPGVRKRATDGDLAFGTVDCYVVHRLTGGREHVTDASNASRTLLMNLHELRWDEQMCEMLGVPMGVLPQIVGCAQIVGTTRGVPGLPDGIPIAGMAGDQHAALFGQHCIVPGDVKCTFGTGAFVLVNTGDKVVVSRHGLLSTVAWKVGDRAVYALEGSAFIAGAAVQWLRDGLGLIKTAAEIEALAREVDNSGGVMFVPALAGLGAPYWDAQARGLICGLTRGTTRAHLAYATLEGIAHEVADLVDAMREDMGAPIRLMRVDGGAAANDLLMQKQADVAGIQVQRPRDLETTARGAAMLAAVGIGIVNTPEHAAGMFQVNRTFDAQISDQDRKKQRDVWGEAVRRARNSANVEVVTPHP